MASHVPRHRRGLDLERANTVVTGAASGIGRAVCRELAARGAPAIAAVDRSDEALATVAEEINAEAGREVMIPHVGDVTDAEFRRSVFDDAVAAHGPVRACVPAAGITRDGLAVKVDEETGAGRLYDLAGFERTLQVNLLSPAYWAMEAIRTVAEDRAARRVGRWSPDEGVEGAIVFIGSVSSIGNVGQVSYAASKAGLDGVRGTLDREAIRHGVRATIVHPGYTETPMVGGVPAEVLAKKILPLVRLGRLLDPAEVADTICFAIEHAAVSGAIWADGGFHAHA